MPAPEGGWELLESGEHNNVVESIEAVEDEVETSSEAEVTTWMAKHKEQWPRLNQDYLQAMLHAAIQATSLDFDVGDQVIKEMIRMYRSGRATKVVEQGGFMLPENMAGCWTEEDDNLLFSKKAEDVAEVHSKHGGDHCGQRLTFLEAYQAYEQDNLVT